MERFDLGAPQGGLDRDGSRRRSGWRSAFGWSLPLVLAATATGTSFQAATPVPGTGRAATAPSGGFIASVSVGPEDDCSTPAVISGLGTFPFDLSGASAAAPGQNEPLCYVYGTTSIATDIWYSWTAPSSGVARFSTCSSILDTKVAAYAGTGCPVQGTALACDDDGCGVQSDLFWPVVQGNPYTIQLGTFPGTAAGTGTFDLSIAPPPPNDTCSNPTPIQGAGTFTFDLLGAMTGSEGQSESLCYTLVGNTIDADVWYAWTAPSSGTYRLETCNGTSVDTKLAVYPGVGCPLTSTSIACNDDFCAGQSMVLFQAIAGAPYTFHIGTSPGAPRGTGLFSVAPTNLPPGDECGSPIPIAGQGQFEWVNYFATTSAEGQQEPPCFAWGTTAIHNDIWYSWTADATGEATVTFCLPLNGMTTKMAAYPGIPACPVPGTALACDDDSCGNYPVIRFPVSTGSTYTLQIGTFDSAQYGVSTFEIMIGGDGIPSPICLGDGSGGICPCGNLGSPGHGCANGPGSTGARLSGDPLASVSGSSWTLYVEGSEPGQPGLFIQGDNTLAGGLGIPFGDGLRCVGGGVVRLEVQVADGNGAAQTSVDIVSVGGVASGDLKRYQWWYRNPSSSPCGTGFNLSNGLEVAWAP